MNIGQLSLFAAISVLTIAGCAKQPEAVEAAKLDHTPYMRFSCANLRTKKAEGEVAVQSLSAKQKSAASNDALGVFLLGLPLASMSGNDPETQLAIAKGQLNAVMTASTAKGCK